MISENEIPFAKVLRPTMEEFADFEQYVENLDRDKNTHNYGLVKIIPPAKWKPRKSNVTTDFENLSVHAPIEQNVQGKSGVYEMLLIQKKSMKLLEYKKKVECFDVITDNKSIEEVEDIFWKNIAFSPPLYGADMAGTLFDAGIPWNLNHLPGLLNEGVKHPIAGVNNSYLYVGSWKTMFGWHKEDLDLYSINYLHYGKPKFWYCLPPSEGKKLEDFARIHFPEAFNKCKELIRHKTLMIHPYLLKQKIPDLKIHKMIQNPGEFVITLGGGYHAGFNWGFNIAEASNFATQKWLEILPNVDSCNCIHDSVRIQKADFYANILMSPIYGKIPAIRKICYENGVTKSKLHAMKSEQDEVESTETADSGDTQPVRRTRQRTLDKARVRSMLGEEEKVPEKPSKAQKSTRVKTVRGKGKSHHEETGEEEGSNNRISNRSKKIKKLGEEFDTSDWKKIRTRNSQTTKSKKQNAGEKKSRGRYGKQKGPQNEGQNPVYVEIES